MHAWSMGFFRNIAGHFGKFQALDDCTSSRRRMDFARISIATVAPYHINKVLKYKIDDLIFNIHVNEECLAGDVQAAGVCHIPSSMNQLGNRKNHESDGVYDAEFEGSPESSFSGESDANSEFSFGKRNELEVAINKPQTDALNNCKIAAEALLSNESGVQVCLQKLMHPHALAQPPNTFDPLQVAHTTPPSGPSSFNPILIQAQTLGPHLMPFGPSCSPLSKCCTKSGTLDAQSTHPTTSKVNDQDHLPTAHQLTNQLKNTQPLHHLLSPLPSSPNQESQSLDGSNTPTSPQPLHMHPNNESAAVNSSPPATLRPNWESFIQDIQSDDGNSLSDANTHSRKSKGKRGRPSKKKDRAKRRKAARKQKILILKSASQNDSQWSDIVGDEDIRTRNKAMDVGNCAWAAEELWRFGKAIGVMGRGNDHEIIAKLSQMEERDKRKGGDEQGELQLNGDQIVDK